MALAGTKTAWATAVVDNLVTLNPEIVGSEYTRLIAVWEKVWESSITHLVTTTAPNVIPGTFSNSGGPVTGLGAIS